MKRGVLRSSQQLVITTFLSLILAFSVMISPVFANVTEEQAKNNLTTYVYGQVSQNDYVLEEGGSVKGADLFEGSPTEGYDLNEDAFQDLSSKAQTELVSDIATHSNEAVDDDSVNGVEESTVQAWWKELQTKQGVGSKFMNEILKNTKPDFVTANKIFQPFSGPLSTIIGVIAIALMAFLGLVLVADIAYIALPPVRMFVSEESGDNGKKISRSKIFSHDAIYAVRVAEDNNNSSNGEGKQALGIYLRRRIVMLILLGICLLYLIQGQIYTLVGYILDLVSGFLGF